MKRKEIPLILIRFLEKEIIICIIVLIILMTKTDSYGQSGNKGSRVILSTSRGIENATFHVYNPPFLAKPIYDYTTEAVNIYPEQLMSSIISADNQAWVNYNTLESEVVKSEKHFQYIQTMNPEENYFELRSKFGFEDHGNEYAIIKFYFHLAAKDEPQSGAYVMQKVSGRWFKTVSSFSTNLSLMIMRFDEVKLQTILSGRPSGEPLIDRVVNQVVQVGVVDINALYELLDSWYAENNTEMLDYFIDKNAW